MSWTNNCQPQRHRFSKWRYNHFTKKDWRRCMKCQAMQYRNEHGDIELTYV